ncbi:MAG: tryptophan synthase subunit beta like protein [Pseudomonadota bacterium]|nr:tryptophan synthase subunit beta like protein [Pseudomonadota bacterium]
MYVKRNTDGQIIAISLEQSIEFQESLASDVDEVKQFLNKAKPNDNELKEAFQASDEDFIRVLEDLIKLLSDKGIIRFTELPTEVQRKLLKRQTIRSGVNKISLFDEEQLDKLNKE